MSLAVWGVIQMMSPFYTLSTPVVPPKLVRNGSPLRPAPRLTLAAAKPSKTLRVARVKDDQSGPGRAGRMVISGRMDEVCAELDRLVLLETRRQNACVDTQLAA
jgi:hypothetical protein